MGKRKEPVEFSSVMQVIRRVLKSKQMTYRDLAEQIGLSESAVKKLFIADDTSFARLNEICGVLEISLSEVLAASKETPRKPVAMSLKAQNYLLKNRDCLSFYWLLVVEKMSVKEIAEANSLSERQTFQYLKKLDELGLIVLHSGTRVRVPPEGQATWINEGPLMEMIREEWSKNLVNEVIHEPVTDQKGFFLLEFRLRPDSADALIRSLRETLREFSQLSHRESNLYPDDLTSIRVFSAYARGGFVNRIQSQVKRNE